MQRTAKGLGREERVAWPVLTEICEESLLPKRVKVSHHAHVVVLQVTR